MSLKDIIAHDNGAKLKKEIEFKEGIIFELNFISKQRLGKLRDSCVVYKYDPRTKMRNPELDSDKFSRMFLKETVTGWSGVTTRSIAKIAPIQSGVELNDVEIEFSQDDLAFLVENAYELDGFLQTICTDPSYFIPDAEPLVKNSEPSQSGS